MNSLRVLVNGATGALGQATIAGLGDHAAIAGTRHKHSSIPDAIYIPSDGKVDPEQLAGIDVIINCAGQAEGSPTELENSNTTHVRNLAVAARNAGVGRFVQVSSFSVYGGAERISAETPLLPVTPYGRSKRQAEQALCEVPGLSVAILRLPFMFGSSKPSKLGPLIEVFRKSPIFPVSRSPVTRSMLSYTDAASLLTEAAVSDEDGISCVADPVPFTIELLIQLMAETGLHTPRLLRIPEPIVAFVTAALPGIGQRLFSSSELDSRINAARDKPFKTGLHAELKSLLSTIQSTT